MLNAEQLFQRNYKRNCKMKINNLSNDTKPATLVCSATHLSSVELANIANELWHFRACTQFLRDKEIYLIIPAFAPEDKLVYILLECLLQELLTRYRINVQFRIKNYKENMNTHGMLTSALFELAKEDGTVESFTKKFNFDINAHHYRRVVAVDGDVMDLSNMYSEIKTFLTYFQMSEDFKSECASVITELVDNALEHGQSDCMVDIDVADSNYVYDIEADNYHEGLFWGVNIVVLNFSDCLLGDEVKRKIKNHKYGSSERYESVQAAYNYHEKYFDRKSYNEDDFFNVTAFQECISGRENEINSGGTGLTELLNNLQEYADDDYCYMITGDKGLFFKKHLIKNNDNHWVGFNDSKNYLSDVPDKSSIFRTKFYFPGTGYNFMFAFKKGEED